MPPCIGKEPHPGRLRPRRGHQEAAGLQEGQPVVPQVPPGRCDTGGGRTPRACRRAGALQPAGRSAKARKAAAAGWPSSRRRVSADHAGVAGLQQRQVQQPFAGVVQQLQPHDGAAAGTAPSALTSRSKASSDTAPVRAGQAGGSAARAARCGAGSNRGTAIRPGRVPAAPSAAARPAVVPSAGRAGSPAPAASRLADSEVRKAVLPARASPVTPMRTVRPPSRSSTSAGANGIRRVAPARSCSRPGPPRRR